MLFNSYEFLFLFLPLTLLGYYVLIPQKARLGFLTVASYLFYGWWDWRFCSLMLISTVIDYQCGKHIHASDKPRTRKHWLLLSLVSNLSLLGFFKYFDLAARSVNQLAAWFGGDPALPLLGLILPVGISFYTFQSMSYSLDIYMRAAKPARSPMAFACYVALFPQLIAGPIVRYRDLSEQLVHRTHTWSKASLGISFFIAGLAKKVLLADGVAFLVGDAFDTPAPDLIGAWAGTLAYTMQIYFDFSGYSDMAVGLGLLFGFRLPRNFNSPYKARSITDFWRRWHISLSAWLRDYLYIPLGGNRRGPLRTYANLLITMLLGGLWHGAHWNFVIWGGYHGGLLALERRFGTHRCWTRVPASLQHGGTFLLILFGWVFFRAESLAQAGAVFRGLAGFNGIDLSRFAHISHDPLPWILLAVTTLTAFIAPNTWEIRWRTHPVWCLLLGSLFLLSVFTILINKASPFLYFQF
jgi:alginate O-acetyltransferase complex protein AlgI